MRLKSSDIFKYYNILISKKIINKEDILFDDDDNFNFNSTELIRTLDSASKIVIKEDDDNLYYISGEEIIKCPEVDDGIENAVIFLCDRIPEFTFPTSDDFTDIQNNEIESLYTCIIVASILRGDFELELKDVILNYDFELIEKSDIKFKLFNEVLNSWLQFQSKIIQAIVSAARENISSKKEQFSSLDLSKLKKEERLKLNVLKDKVRIYFNEFKREKLNDTSIKNLKKHEIYKLYDERNTFIKERIIGSAEYISVVTYYLIDKLNYEDVNPFIKKKIFDGAVEIVKDVYKEENLSKDSYLKLVNKFNRKGIKIFLRKWKNKELDKYLINKEGYALPKKL